ncbi:DUF554 domain-containing protein [Desulfobaculum bizertense]|uniref:DUF554 domain-containing protein n=1 Tax=Desulfobaculum bizertense DSM 18034 TaxID=1121442 RepID=A0A1T4W9E5_9BACT|nr:DUF554 domain-containing protein [Desulfobaculum bizertense]UIJ39220.1 DUF554 domain-containing protein [Desulfobaculum bizertense]SKA73668.1 hypothetical protein SAMN02745702_01896 [Desulfobaculum bizertense DSM 18034]
MQHIPIGSLVNVVAIIIGGFVGMAFRSRMPEGIRTIVFQGLGLSTLALGVSMSLKMQNILIIIFSIVLGGIIGELCNLDKRLEQGAIYLKKKIKSKNELFVDGCMTATLLYCIGSMAIIGAFDEGLRGDPTILLTKSMMDGFAAIALGASYGVGVVFSALPVFIYQYGLTLFAIVLQPYFTQEIITQLTATGGILIIGISINILDLKQIKLSNMIPSLIIVVILSVLF